MTYKSDEEIKSEVMFQLGWDSRINQTEIGVAVKKGVVTLTGRVGSYAEKLAAKESAHKVRGVLDVANDIEVEVRGKFQPSDSEIAHAVRHALEWDVLVPAENIHSTVTDGLVTLEGNVEFYRERLDAERAIAHLSGVRAVVNRIKIVAPIEPDRVKYLIEDILELRADRKADRIKVEVDEGEVTLTGAVTSWDEKKAILGAVSHTPGVTFVHDCLFIDLYGQHSGAASS